MPRADDARCPSCGSPRRCLVCAPTSLTSREALSEILSVVARVRREPPADNAADAVLMETERTCRAILGPQL